MGPEGGGIDNLCVGVKEPGVVVIALIAVQQIFWKRGEGDMPIVAGSR